MAAATDGSGSARAAAAAASTSPRTASNGCGLTGKPPGSPASSAAAAEPGSAATSSAGLPASVSHFYYKHGLFLSSYPTCASSIAFMAILLSCYPLINIPLPGTIPTKIVVPYEAGYGSPTAYNHSGSTFAPPAPGEPLPVGPASPYNGSATNRSVPPLLPWAQSRPPFFFVQQITLRASVLPWAEGMQLMDAFRAPLYEVFKLLEIVRNHQSNENQRTLEHNCVHVENVKRGTHGQQIFPEYGCLLLSPANMWSQNAQNFSRDTNILNTIFQYHNLQKSKVSAAEMLFGLPMQDTGFKRYPLRARSRIIQYALTLILKDNDLEYLETLKEKLQLHYPPLPLRPSASRSLKEPSTITYIFYPGEYRMWELVPYTVAFMLVFAYVYFSVRKIDVFRSRLLLALCSVITTAGSLAMSLGLCFFFGLTISLQSKDIFPYLVILVGLENSLVITKSVVSIDETFDVKIRVAKALSKEGWHISKTLLTEITILTIGLATFVPVIQEFCIFAIVGLLSDFMLQMLLFSTILAMNIKRAEYTTEAKHLPKMLLSCTQGAGRQEFRFFGATPSMPPFVPGTFQRSQSHPKLCFADASSVNDRTSLVNAHSPQEQRIPKRIKIVNFWARTRFFQRAFMIWMIVWICSIVYNSGCLEQLFSMESNGTMTATFELHRRLQAGRGAVSSFFEGWQADQQRPTSAPGGSGISTTLKSTLAKDINETAEDVQRLRYPNFDLNYFLSNFHWSTIMKQYNISLSGHYVTLLPTIRLSHAISPELATLLRNPQEQLQQNFQWKALAAALDPLDFNDDDVRRDSPMVMGGGMPLVPKSPMEIFFAILLCCISIFVLCYTMVVFYRCICTRNYAEWRSSWHESEAPYKQTEQILEGVPTQIAGHKHRIECLVSDGAYIISCCLKGQIRVWDARSGEQLTSIARSDIQISHLRPDGQTLVRKLAVSPVWCLDYFDNLIAVGCANGRVELWESPAGLLKCAYQEDVKRNQGITHIHLNGDRVIVARLSGRLDFYRLETYYKGKQIDWGFTSAYRRTHVRTGSTGSLGLMMHQQRCQQDTAQKTTKEEMKITLEGVRLAHQQPITCMQVVNDMVFTGSQDHTLKVYCLNKSDAEYTLHGHCGPVTCLFMDRWQPCTGGSGSQDGLLCVWDLFTGACMYNIQAHDGAVSCLACAPSYVISLGTDERICVWERFQGNLLTTINISNAYSSLLMLTPSLLVTSKMGSLIVWDVRTGQPAREVKLDFANLQLCPKIMMLACDSVVCDYGNEIRVVRFPIVADKCH
ncbi:sterol regulatory element-binding protein cleavage-activating protein isoform X1 [Drosophila suzukii]|uniref:Sterol regulatory element-binding protein cleavage-activating protein n=1 Tax=Drosophila suzukii TaxID=28584 RepID=A0AB39ZAA2_DROSZ|nr:sterol regulatory element-binding protein cleavage-activating protein isoform X1 [Drosophila suzukii]XP_036677783.1 LOW QUALITY PROTEIN: sterol regulatory element-binding protein cleavage-activating protein-like [Drosophila suzukii]